MAKDDKTPDSVDQIRNILFGEQVTIINKRFEALEVSLKSAISDLSKQVQENQKNINQNIETLQKNHNSGTKDMQQMHESSINQLESSITNKITEVESDILNQLQDGLQKLDDKASHRSEMARLLKEMANKLAD